MTRSEGYIALTEIFRDDSWSIVSAELNADKTILYKAVNIDGREVKDYCVLVYFKFLISQYKNKFKIENIKKKHDYGS